MEDIDDVVDGIQRGFKLLANAITPAEAMAGTDAAGGRVESLTEAVMGMTAAMVQIAGAITDLADAVRERDAQRKVDPKRIKNLAHPVR